MDNSTTKLCALCHQTKSNLCFLSSWFTEDELDVVCYQCRTGKSGFVQRKGSGSFLRSKAGKRAIDYWNHRCAICGRLPDEYFSLAIDHWYPLTYTGDDSLTNMLPMCHTRRKGQGSGCNSNKRNQNPVLWLYERLGTDLAQEKLRQINAYFEWADEQDRYNP